jgi:glycylpeptide N-tetradecanoyltransferase
VHGVFQAVYTVGTLLPTPISTCRYFHRALNWEKLYDVGFSPLPTGSTKARQIARYKLPEETLTAGLRKIEAKDVDTVVDLLRRYLERMNMAQVYSKTDFEHWMLPSESSKEQIVWSYVVEDPASKKVTDFFSFYSLESTVIGHKKHDVINAAYLFYYATETAFAGNEESLKNRLNELMKDALILAKKVST